MPPSTIPPAPPLPPPKPPQSTARSAFARFVTQPFSAYGSRPASAQANRSDVGRAAAAVPRISGITSLASQDAGLKISSGTEITALDINNERTHAVVAGRELLQTIRVDAPTCIEETNLRAAVRERNRQQSIRQRDGLDIHAVKWSHGQFSTYIAAAATNGKVVIYDLNRPGIEVARLHEHHRQVHCLSINPFQGHMLLSGSQDATVRLWDLRDTRSEAMMCRSRSRYMGQSDGIRDVRWSPKDGVEFAFGTDGGVVQGWDYRNLKSAKLRINAHDRACTAIDWHPDGIHLLSASQDKTVLVWDFSTDIRRPKPQWTLKAPYPVFNARWRPPCWTTDTRGQGAWQCTQIATSYERPYPTVHIWDFRRIYMPFREFQTAETAPSDILWHSQDLLWSVSREGRFQQTDIHFAPKVIDRRPLTALAISPLGEMAVFAQKRGRRRGSDIEYVDESEETAHDRGHRAASEKTQLSRSSFDDSVDENFLSSSYGQQHHERRQSNRTTKSLSSTPPSVNESGVVKLDETLKEGRGIFTPNQVAYRVTLDGTLDSLAFSYLAQKYKHPNAWCPIDSASIANITTVFEQNASYAQRCGLYRLAQSWRLFGAATRVEMLQTMSDRNLARMLLGQKVANAVKSLPDQCIKEGHLPEQRVKDGSRYTGVTTISDLTEGQKKDVRLIESDSNAPTPLARPRNQSPSSVGVESGSMLPDPDEDDAQLVLPASLSLSPSPQTSRAYLRTEDHRQTQSRPIDIPPPLDRHYSNDSFAFTMSASDGGRPDATGQNQPELIEESPKSPTPSQSLSDKHPASTPSSAQIESDTQSLAKLAVSQPITESETDTSELAGISEGEKITGGEFGPVSLGELITADARGREVLATNGFKPPGPPVYSLIQAENNAKWDRDLPFDMEKMLDECYHYFSDKHIDPQFLTHLTLLLQPTRIPSQATIDSLKDEALIPLARLLTQDVKDIDTQQYCITKNLCNIEWAGIDRLHLQSIIQTYLDLLERHQAFNAACVIRKAVKGLPIIDEASQLRAARSKIGLVCDNCEKPIHNPGHALKCDKCGAFTMPCPYCWQYRPPFPLPGKRSKKADAPTSGALLEFCMVCGHHGHPGCWDKIQQDPEYGGHCIVAECDCACKPGPYRMKTIKEEEERNVKGVIRGEERKVGESKAVEGARKLLEPTGAKKVAFLDGSARTEQAFERRI